MTPYRKTARTAAPLHPLLASRWSPRALDPDHLTPMQALALVARLSAEARGDGRDDTPSDTRAAASAP